MAESRKSYLRHATILLALLLTICYSNTFSSPWHLDDLPNITNNAPLRINNLMPETLWQTLHAKPFAPGTPYRPVSNFTFALNWYLGQDNPLGYHIVNLLIHILAALILYQTMLLLFQTPVLRNHSRQDALFIALLSTVLWAINPIQTQAVTYIVQRMASLAAMFYIWAIFWYLRFRLSRTPERHLLPLLLCCLCYILSIGSKENGAVLPLSLLALEFIFFPKPQESIYQNTRKLLLAFGFAIIPAGLWYCIHHNYFHDFFTPIGSRPFSLYERLLTEPSILLFYINLIFYPLPQRLSVDHEVTIAHSLFGNPSTVASVLAILGLVCFGLLLMKKRPILSFAILFFFINHLVESTIIPLELIFEHRNYLPSMFLFMPLSAGLLYLIKQYFHRNRTVYIALILCIPLIITSTGWSTYTRNNVWRSERSLWLDAAKKAPNNARPWAKLGELEGWNPRRSPERLALAIGYYQKSLTGYSPRTSFKAAIYGNMGEVFFMYGLYDKAITYYAKSLDLNPHFNNSQYGMAKALVMEGKFDKAFETVAKALNENHAQSRFLNIGGLILLWQDKPAAALWSFQQAMKISKNKEQYFFNLGVALSKAGHHKRAAWFLRLSNQASPYDIKILFSLLENSVRAKDQRQADQYATQILTRFSLTTIEKNLQNVTADYRIIPISTSLIAPVLREQARKQVQNFSRKPADRIGTDAN